MCVSFVLDSEDTTEQGKGEMSQSTVQMTSETHGRQRPSLIEFLTGGELGRHGSKIISDHHMQQMRGWFL